MMLSASAVSRPRMQSPERCSDGRPDLPARYGYVKLIFVFAVRLLTTIRFSFRECTRARKV
jgi:hypothetical protein